MTHPLSKPDVSPAKRGFSNPYFLCQRRVLKSSRPSFKEGSTFLTKPLFPQGREGVAGSAIAPPGVWSASGACARKGLAGLTQQSCECLSASTLSNLLIACSFSAFFLVVSIKKLIFAEKFNV